MNTTHSNVINLTEKDEFVECKWRQIECDRPIKERGKKACVLCVLGGINQSLETIADALTPTKTRPVPIKDLPQDIIYKHVPFADLTDFGRL